MSIRKGVKTEQGFRHKRSPFAKPKPAQSSPVVTRKMTPEERARYGLPPEAP